MQSSCSVDMMSQSRFRSPEINDRRSKRDVPYNIDFDDCTFAMKCGSDLLKLIPSLDAWSHGAIAWAQKSPEHMMRS